MSWAALEWARQQKAGKSGRKFCLIMIANYADESGTCYPRVEKLASDMEAGVSTVHTYLTDLEKAGLIRVLVRYAKRGSRRSNRYQLMMQGADTPMPEGDDWHYERPTPAARRRKAPDSGGMPDQGDHASDIQRLDDHASEYQMDMPPDSGGTSIQNLEATSSKEFNRKEEPPTGTSAAPSGRRTAEAAQTTIDGTEEALAPSTTEIAFGIADVWINWWKSKGTPIAAPNPKHQLKSLAKTFLDAGYAEEELRAGLRALNEPIPSRYLLQRELIRARGGNTGAPAQRGAAARVNDHWRKQEGKQPATVGAPPRAERINTEGADW